MTDPDDPRFQTPTGAGNETDDLFARLYDELHRAAAEKLRRESRDHTLQPAAVVHETYLRLAAQSDFAVTERTHFLAVAARAMHQVLVDHARQRHARKRGGGWRRITLVEGLASTAAQTVDLLALEQALAALAAHHARAARIVELRFFGGLDEREIASELGLSRTTVQGEWRLARAWLHRELSAGEESTTGGR